MDCYITPASQQNLIRCSNNLVKFDKSNNFVFYPNIYMPFFQFLTYICQYKEQPIPLISTLKLHNSIVKTIKIVISSLENVITIFSILNIQQTNSIFSSVQQSSCRVVLYVAYIQIKQSRQYSPDSYNEILVNSKVNI